MGKLRVFRLEFQANGGSSCSGGKTKLGEGEIWKKPTKIRSPTTRGSLEKTTKARRMRCTHKARGCRAYEGEKK